MLKLVQKDWGRFDLEMERPDEGDDSAAATLVYAALFTDAEADSPSSRVTDRYDRRGWWADPKAGSDLWHVRRQPLDGSARKEALALVRRTIAERAPALRDIRVRETKAPSGAGSISNVFVDVDGMHNGRRFIVRVSL
uniref:Phage protein GP46 n=1 Tax=Candidatus Kentrum sp. LFY TaxID=2126342 RepID=A0A450UE25_9GAMM|nr:MAG: Phage protein GP46 [Candidatus Kentron sp. LFY]